MKFKDLNGIVRERLDMRGREYIRPLRESLATQTTGPTEDEPEKGPCEKHGDPECRKCGKTWRPCPSCKSPKDGKFRMICLNFGEKECRVCRQEKKESCERFAFRSKEGELDKLANLWLKKEGRERINRKGFMAVKSEGPRNPWEEK